MVRARWTQIYRNTPSLRTAFAFRSIINEVIFIIGPIVAIGLSVSLFPEAGPLAAMILLALGVLLLSAQRATKRPIHAQEARGGISVIRVRPVQLVVFVMVAIGAIFGTAEVTAVAFAEAQGQKAAASLVLASYAAGSLIVGLVFGALRLQMPLAKQFLLAIMLALTTLPAAGGRRSADPGGRAVPHGGSVSPTIIVAMGLIERLVRPSKLTEEVVRLGHDRHRSGHGVRLGGIRLADRCLWLSQLLGIGGGRRRGGPHHAGGLPLSEREHVRRRGAPAARLSMRRMGYRLATPLLFCHMPGLRSPG